MWIILGLLSAFLDAGRNLVMKRNLTKQHTHPIIIAWATVFYALPITVSLLLFRPLPEVQEIFWMAAGAAVALDVISLFLYAEAVKRTELSLCLPMLAFVPLFLLASSYLISRESPTGIGYLGVGLVMLGAYLLNFDPKKSRWYDPLLAIFHNKGTAMMFVVAFIWGTTSALHKVAIVASDALFYTGVTGVSISLVFTILAVLIDPRALRRAFHPKHALKLAPIGLMDGLAILAQFVGQGMTLSVFVVSLKRTSIIWSALGGAVLFKEKIGQRVFPIMLMLVGIVALSLSKT